MATTPPLTPGGEGKGARMAHNCGRVIKLNVIHSHKMPGNHHMILATSRVTLSPSFLKQEKWLLVWSPSKS